MTVDIKGIQAALQAAGCLHECEDGVWCLNTHTAYAAWGRRNNVDERDIGMQPMNSAQVYPGLLDADQAAEKAAAEKEAAEKAAAEQAAAEQAAEKAAAEQAAEKAAAEQAAAEKAAAEQRQRPKR